MLESAPTDQPSLQRGVPSTREHLIVRQLIQEARGEFNTTARVAVNADAQIDDGEAIIGEVPSHHDLLTKSRGVLAALRKHGRRTPLS